MLNEKKLSKAELAKREDIIMKMKKNKSALVKKYGKDAEKVMYGRATNIAKKQAESMENTKIREMIKTILQGPVSEKKGKDMDGDGDIDSQDYLAAKDAAIKKNIKEWGSSDQSAMNQSIHRDLGNPTEFPGLTQIMRAAEDAVDFYWDDWDEYQTDREGLIMHAAQMYANKMFPEFMAGMRRMMEPIDEMDINDPIAMKLRAEKDKLAKMRAANAGDDGNDKFFKKSINPNYKAVKNASKIAFLKKERAQLMRDMEQEAEPEGGPIADRYGRELNKIDKAIAKLEGHGEWGPEKDTDITAQEIAKRAAMFGLEEGTELYNRDGFYFKRFYGGKENGASLQITTDKGDFITIPGRKLGLFMSGLEKAVSEFDDMSRQLPVEKSAFQKRLDKLAADEKAKRANKPVDEDLDLGHEDNEPHMLKADLYRIGKYAMELYQILDQFEAGSEEVDLPSWWQAKIINSKDAIVGAKHYLDFELKEPQIDAMVDVASEEEAIEEPVNEGTWSVGSSSEIKKVMDLLDKAMDVKDPQALISMLEKSSKIMYNVVGDDLFHDDIDGAKSEAKEGNMDRAQNRLSDAYSRAAFFQERQMDREGFKESKLNEEEPGEADMVASDIQKAMNKHKGDDSKMYQLQQARKAMNKGDLDKAKKIAARLAEKLTSKKKANEQFVTEELAKFIKNGNTLDEGFFDRLAAKVKGGAAGIGQAFKNVGAVVKGDKDAIKSTSVASGIAKLNSKAKNLDADLNDMLNDINRLFPDSKLEKVPQLKTIITQYVDALNKAKKTNADLASGEISLPKATGSAASTTDPKGISTGETATIQGEKYDIKVTKDNKLYIETENGIKYVTTDKTFDYDEVKAKSPKSSTTPEKKSGPARDEKGRFVTNKKPDVKPELIDNNFEMTKKIYTYKGKNYQVQVDKKTKEEFFQHEDGRVMDIAAIDRNSKVKKKK